MVSQSGGLAQNKWSKFSDLAQAPWDAILDEVPLDPEYVVSSSWGGTDCVGRPNFANVTSFVSANNAETLEGLSGDLGQTNTVGPPINKTIHNSSPTPISDEVLDATTKVVVTKPPFRKEDEGPS